MSVALSITNLKKIYDSGVVALRGIDMEVAEGDFFALLGANGAGKSTIIGVICSLVLKSSGDVKIFGVDIDKDFVAAKLRTGVVPQEFNFHNFNTVQNIITTQAGYYGVGYRIARERTKKILELLGLWEYRNTIAIQLSGGMKRRLMIARALVHQPDLLILDEPTAGVDIELRHTMWDFLLDLNRRGTTIILTTHYLEEAEYLCRKVAIIDKGEIIHSGSMDEILKRLSQQIFVLDLSVPLDGTPDFAGFESKLTDRQTLEVILKPEDSLNQLFAELRQKNIEATSIRPRRNKLEELYVSLVSGNSG